MASSFVYIIGRSLKHAKSGRCIHTSGAWPGNGRQMVLWSGCEEQRLQLFFGKQGTIFCPLSHLLGISSRKAVASCLIQRYIEKVLFQALGGPSFAVWERYWSFLAPYTLYIASNFFQELKFELRKLVYTFLSI